MKNRRRFQDSLALTVLLSFALLVQSAPPSLPAESGAVPVEGPTAVASADQPGATEIPAVKAPHAKKKRFPWGTIVFPVILVGAAAAVLIPILTKDKYDIIGTWHVDTTWPEPDNRFGLLSYGFTITFSPYNTFFTVVFDIGGVTFGSYRQDGRDVSFRLNDVTQYAGQFIDEDSLSGTMTDSFGLTGTWTAVRIANGD